MKISDFFGLGLLYLILGLIIIFYIYSMISAAKDAADGVRETKEFFRELGMVHGFSKLGHLTGKTINQVSAVIGIPHETKLVTNKETGTDVYRVTWEKGRYTARFIFTEDKVFDHIDREEDRGAISRWDPGRYSEKMFLESMTAEEAVKKIGGAYSREFREETRTWLYEWRSQKKKFIAEFSEDQHEFIRVVEKSKLPKKKRK